MGTFALASDFETLPAVDWLIDAAANQVCLPASTAAQAPVSSSSTTCSERSTCSSSAGSVVPDSFS